MAIQEKSQLAPDMIDVMASMIGRPAPRCFPYVTVGDAFRRVGIDRTCRNTHGTWTLRLSSYNLYTCVVLSIDQKRGYFSSTECVILRPTSGEAFGSTSSS